MSEERKKQLKVIELFDDYGTLYAKVVEGGRTCYYHVEKFSTDIVLTKEDVAKYLMDSNVSIINLPYIENASEAIKYLYHEINHSDNCMVFIDNDNISDLPMPVLEFINQVDSDIKKFNLQDVIVKGEDDCLYTCYGELMQKFTERA